MFDNTDATDFFGAEYDFDKTVITDTVAAVAADAFVTEMQEKSDVCVLRRGTYDGRGTITIAAYKKQSEDFCRIADIVVFLDDLTAKHAFTGFDTIAEAERFVLGG